MKTRIIYLLTLLYLLIVPHTKAQQLHIQPLSHYEFMAQSANQRPQSFQFDGRYYRVTTSVRQASGVWPIIFKDDHLLRVTLNDETPVSPKRTRYHLSDRIIPFVERRDFENALKSWHRKWIAGNPNYASSPLQELDKSIKLLYYLVYDPDGSAKKKRKKFKAIIKAEAFTDFMSIVSDYKRTLSSSISGNTLSKYIQPEDRKYYRTILPKATLGFKLHIASEDDWREVMPMLRADINIVPEVLINKSTLTALKVYGTVGLGRRSIELDLNPEEPLFLNNSYVESSVTDEWHQLRRIDSITLVNYAAEVGLRSQLSLGTTFSIFYEIGSQYQLGDMDLRFRGGEDYYFVDGDRRLIEDKIENIAHYNEDGNTLIYQEFGFSVQLGGRKHLGKTKGRLARRGFVFAAYARLFDVPDILMPNDIFVRREDESFIPVSQRRQTVFWGLVLGWSF